MSFIKNKKLKINSMANQDFYKSTFKVLCYSSLFLAFCYVYFLSGIVFHIVARKNYENDVRLLTSKIGEMEHQYLTLSHDVDMAYATEHGFAESNNTLFLTKETVSLR